MLAFVSLAEGGERSFVFYRNPSADMLLRPEDLALEVIDAHAALHFGTISLISEPARSATLAAVNHALAQDKLVSYDPNLRMNLWPDELTARRVALDALPLAHIVKLSEEELDFLGGDLSALWRERTRMIVVTQGAGGATLYTRQDSLYQPAFPVRPIDTTGAGDGFVAGLLIGLLEAGDDYLAQLEPILRFANAVGALATTQYGAFFGMPTRAEVEALIAAGR